MGNNTLIAVIETLKLSPKTQKSFRLQELLIVGKWIVSSSVDIEYTKNGFASNLWPTKFDI